MKKLIVLTVLVVIGIGVYQFIAAGIRYSRLDHAVIQDLDGAAYDSPEQIRQTVLRDADGIGISLEPETVVVTTEETNEKGLAGQVLSGAGMRVQSRVAKLRLAYREQILVFSREYSMERQHTYTATAQVAPPATGPEPESAPVP